MTGKTVAAAGQGHSGDRELDDQAGNACPGTHRHPPHPLAPHRHRPLDLRGARHRRFAPLLRRDLPADRDGHRCPPPAPALPRQHHPAPGHGVVARPLGLCSAGSSGCRYGCQPPGTRSGTRRAHPRNQDRTADVQRHARVVDHLVPPPHGSRRQVSPNRFGAPGLRPSGRHGVGRRGGQHPERPDGDSTARRARSRATISAQSPGAARSASASASIFASRPAELHQLTEGTRTRGVSTTATAGDQII